MEGARTEEKRQRLLEKFLAACERARDFGGTVMIQVIVKDGGQVWLQHWEQSSVAEHIGRLEDS